MTRVFSGIQPSGETHLGNYLGAIQNWTGMQHDQDCVFCVVDLHAMTQPYDPAELRGKTMAMMTMLLACGLDPEVCTLFVQSHAPEHTQLGWLMQCNVAVGELQRMVQFKDKSQRHAGDMISTGLLTYPALQAADILLYDADQVPVGEDQRQHIELCREVAERFNNRYGKTFVLPRMVAPPAGARVMDLHDPTKKMSKSLDSPQGTVLVLDDPKDIERKFKRAVTDSDGEVRFDVNAKPGVSNLLSIYAGCTGMTPEAAASQFSQYGPLKAATAAAVIETLAPVQSRYRELSADPAEVGRLIAHGAARARAISGPVLARAMSAVGLLSG